MASPYTHNYTPTKISRGRTMITLPSPSAARTPKPAEQKLEEKTVELDESQVPSVQKLKGWLVDFEKQNKQHFEKNNLVRKNQMDASSEIRQEEGTKRSNDLSFKVPASPKRSFPSKNNVSVSSSATKVPIRPKQSAVEHRRKTIAPASTSSQKLPTGYINPIVAANRKVWQAKVLKEEVKATDNGHASVEKLSMWLQDDPFDKKKAKPLRWGSNVISKSQAYSPLKLKGAAATAKDEIALGNVSGRKQWLQKAFKHDEEEEEQEGVPSDVIGKKLWLENAFKKSSSDNDPFKSRADISIDQTLLQNEDANESVFDTTFLTCKEEEAEEEEIDLFSAHEKECQNDTSTVIDEELQDTFEEDEKFSDQEENITSDSEEAVKELAISSEKEEEEEEASEPENIGDAMVKDEQITFEEEGTFLSKDEIVAVDQKDSVPAHDEDTSSEKKETDNYDEASFSAFFNQEFSKSLSEGTLVVSPRENTNVHIYFPSHPIADSNDYSENEIKKSGTEETASINFSYSMGSSIEGSTAPASDFDDDGWGNHSSFEQARMKVVNRVEPDAKKPANRFSAVQKRLAAFELKTKELAYKEPVRSYKTTWEKDSAGKFVRKTKMGAVTPRKSLMELP